MHCPDCDGSLVEITLTGIDKSFRCFHCGGLWVKDNTLSELSIRALEDWKPIQFDKERLMAGANRCPQDGLELKQFTNNRISGAWNVRKCDECLGWWWPTDTLFRVREVVHNKTGYMKIKEGIINEVS